MNRIQVVVKKGDRHWDSIRDSREQSLFRVCEHMKKTDPEIARIGDLAEWKLIFGKFDDAVRVLNDQGFEVQFKDI